MIVGKNSPPNLSFIALRWFLKSRKTGSSFGGPSRQVKARIVVGRDCLGRYVTAVEVEIGAARYTQRRRCS